MKLSEFRKKFGEGTDFDLDYGKLFIIGLCIYNYKNSKGV